MTGIRVKVAGSDRLKTRLRKLDAEARKGVTGAIALGAKEVQGAAQRTIQRGTRSGAPTWRYSPRRLVVPSAPGEPPKTDLGRLASSIDAEVDKDGLGASVGTNLDYGRHLELGTRKMAARPWLQPTFERLRKKVGKRIQNAVKQAFDRGPT